MASKKQKGKRDFERVKLDIGSRYREIRVEAFDKMSQQKFGELIEDMDVSNRQGRIAVLEKGKGSAEVIYSVLLFLYEQGINLHYLFGDEPLYRTSQGSALYPENVTDYVKEVNLLAGEAREKLDELVRSTQQMGEYVSTAVGEDAADRAE